MKLSNKILIAFFSLIVILTLIVMIKVKSIHNEYKQNLTLGNEHWVTAEFPLQEFNELEVGNHFKVNWHKGVPMVKVKIEENLKPFFRASQDGQKVKIHFDSLSSYRINGSIIVDVYSQSLDNINLEDFVEFVAKDTLVAKELKIELNDHCNVEILANGESLFLRQYDFSNLIISGLCGTADIKMGDHSHLDGGHLDLSAAVIDMSDFSQAIISVRSRMKVECQDHANLEYIGDSVQTEIIQRDFSEVTKENK